MEKRHSHHQFITIGGTSSRPKYTTRHLAALDFLLNVPMRREEEIRRTGLLNATRMKEESDSELNFNEDALINFSDKAQPLSSSNFPTAELIAAQYAEYAGKKLQGPHCPIGRYPAHFRYHLQKLTEHSALVRQWEDQLLAKPSVGSGAANSSSSGPSVLTNRIFFSRAHCYPMAVFSVIKYDAGEEKARIEKIKAEDTKGLEVYNLPHRDWRGFSYKPLFKQLQEERKDEYYFERGFLYDPNALDDPAMIHGAHRYVLQRSASTGPILSSIILYVNKKELKESLNEQFHEKHPHIPPSLTLSKIRNLKKQIVLVGVNKLNLELSTLALGCILFEKLCLKCLVTKSNRKLSMAVCVLLAYKFNENNNRFHQVLESLLAFFDTEWDLPRKQIFEAEFGAYVHLNFLLHLPHQHIHWMYMSLLKLVNKSSRMYLKDDMYEVYRQDVGRVQHLKEAMAHNLKERDGNKDARDGSGGGTVAVADKRGGSGTATASAALPAAGSEESGAEGGGEDEPEDDNKATTSAPQLTANTNTSKRRMPMGFGLLGRSTKNLLKPSRDAAGAAGGKAGEGGGLSLSSSSGAGGGSGGEEALSQVRESVSASDLLAHAMDADQSLSRLDQSFEGAPGGGSDEGEVSGHERHSRSDGGTEAPHAPTAHRKGPSEEGEEGVGRKLGSKGKQRSRGLLGGLLKS